MSTEPVKKRFKSSLSFAQPPDVQQRISGLQTTDLVANYFRFNLKSAKYYAYHLDFEPHVETDAKRLRGAILRPLFKELGLVNVFDGTTLVSNDENLEQKAFTSKFKDTEYKISIKRTKEITGTAVDPALLHMFGIVYRSAFARCGLQLVGRSYVDPKSDRARDLVQLKAKIWPGVAGGIQITESGSFLNLDFKQKIMRSESVYDAIRSTKSNQAVLSIILNAVVLTKYNNKMYRISNVDFTQTPTSSFSDEQEKTQTYADYYATKYNIKIYDMKQPLLVSKVRFRGQGKKEIRLIPELCYMTGISQRELGRARKDLILNASQRVSELNSFVNKVAKHEDAKKVFAKWGVELVPQMENIKGHLLAAENLTFGNKKELNVKNGSWQNEWKSSSIYSPAKLSPWIIVCTEQNNSTARSFVGSLKKVGQGMNVKVDDPVDIVTCSNDQDGSDLVRKIRGCSPDLINKLMFIMVILPDNSAERYGYVKNFLATKLPMISQCAVPDKLSKGLSVATNILLQIQSKLQAELWISKFPFPSPVMIVGIHVAVSQKKTGESIGALCATLNTNCNKHYTRVFYKKTGQEIVDNLKNFMIGAVNKFEEVNSKKPFGIIVYREGASEGQLDQLLHNEINDIKEGFSKMPSPYDPAMCYISVNKKVNQKFFKPAGTGKFANPEIGTVIDRGITEFGKYEFFLISATANQGCTNPVQYRVVYNSTKLNMKILATVTYKLTHMYYNWSGTIRIPAPLMYATKCVMQVGSHIQVAPDAKLESHLYFL